jgi:hypothetical protein
VSGSRILLVRHGRSAHVSSGWLDAPGVRRWFDAYDAAGIATDDAPPASLRAQVAGAGIVVASDLPRARASAERLAPGARVELSPLLREVALPLPALAGARLPLAAWGLCVGAGLAYRRLRRAPPPPATCAQAEAAAAWLAGLADRHGSVVAVVHALVRGHIAAALCAHGWRRTPGERGLGHWSARTLTRAAPRDTAAAAGGGAGSPSVQA